MRRAYEKLTAILLYSGIAACIVYVVYAVMGNHLWPEYNPITTDISSLSAAGAPNQELLAPFLSVYGICFLMFVLVFLIWNFCAKKPTCLKSGSVLLFVMALVSKFGYSLFPLSGDKTEMTFQNMMHMITTVAVVFLSIVALYLIAAGYRSIPNHRRFGNVMLVLTTVFTILGATNPIGMRLTLDILGLTERAAIYSLHLIIGVIGIYESVSIFRHIHANKTMR